MIPRREDFELLKIKSLFISWNNLFTLLLKTWIASDYVFYIATKKILSTITNISPQDFRKDSQFCSNNNVMWEVIPGYEKLAISKAKSHFKMR